MNARSERKVIAFFLFSALVLAGTFWADGFLTFVDQVRAYRQPVLDETLPATQGLVVLTGGSERVVAGADLLRAGKGLKLLISGVHASVKTLPSLGLAQDVLDCCVVLGRAAGDTYGNAIEARAFMEGQRYESLTLVTAHYHMPRSLLLFESAMPDKRIVPFSVQPDSVDLSAWWRRTGTASLLAMEYNKYLLARLCLWIGVF